MPPSYDSLNSSLEEPENNGSSAVIDAQNGTTVTQVPVAKPLITRRGSLFRLNKLAFA
jgi:hypothetical protein